MLSNTIRSWLKATLLISIFCSVQLTVFTSSCYASSSVLEVDSENSIPTNAIAPCEDPVTFALLAEENSLMPGRPLWLAIDVKMTEGWHSYWKYPGASGMPIQIDWNLPEGFSVGEIQWPTPQRFDQSGLIGYGYDTPTTLLVRLQPPSTLSDTLKSVDLEAEITWLVCSDSTCLPGDTNVTLSLPILQSTPAKNDAVQAHFAKALAALPKECAPCKVSKKGLSIELQIDCKDCAGVEKEIVSFIPAKPGMINEHQPTKCHKNAGSDSCVLSLEAGKKRYESLEGVIIVGDAKDNRAFAIDHPIDFGSDDSVVAMADEPSHKSDTKKVTHTEENAEYEGGISFGLILAAFLGGLCLNIMPCVFPVISFKILSFVNMAGKSRSITLLHGTAFSMGVIASFWALAGILLFLRSSGFDAGWGFQLQQPVFIGLLTLVLFALSLSLLGVFEIGLSLTSAAGTAQQKASTSFSSLGGSFFSGVLATTVAAPCTGPMMAPALGYAVTLPAASALLIFTALGVGMASPYLLLSAFPKLLGFLPRPGAWMETFKQLMGFILLATVVWLMTVFEDETLRGEINMLLVAILLVAFACWIYGRSSLSSSLRSQRIGLLLGAIFLITSGTIVSFASPKPDENTLVAANNNLQEWEPFTIARFEELRSQNIPVFIDFTAKWCMICQVNHLILSTEAVEEEFLKRGVVKMKADWTRHNPDITQMLKKFGRNGVPLYVLYGDDPNQSPQVLPQLLTPGIITNAINELALPIALRDGNDAGL